MGRSVNGDVYGVEPAMRPPGNNEKIEITGNMNPNQWAAFRKDLKDVIAKYPNLTFSTKPI